MGDHYILGEDGKTPVHVDLMEWAEWFETADRRVAATEIGVVGDDDANRVSTVFLGLDHSFETGPPLLFETMVFGGPMDQEMDRYTTWEEAEAGHLAMVNRVKASGKGA